MIKILLFLQLFIKEFAEILYEKFDPSDCQGAHVYYDRVIGKNQTDEKI